jgi:hypothetical protein
LLLLVLLVLLLLFLLLLLLFLVLFVLLLLFLLLLLLLLVLLVLLLLFLLLLLLLLVFFILLFLLVLLIRLFPGAILFRLCGFRFREHCAGQPEVVPRIGIIRVAQEHFPVRLGCGIQLAFMEAAIAQVIQGIGFYCLAFDAGEGFRGLAVLTGPVLRDAAPIGVGEVFSGFFVLALLEQLGALLFPVLEQVGVCGLGHTQKAKQQQRLAAHY